MQTKIAIVGEYINNFDAHLTLNNSLDYLQDEFNFAYEWVDTLAVAAEGRQLLSQYQGIWSAPGSPFNSLEGALNAITYARSSRIPHLGTCAGFQHAMTEIARNVLGLQHAQHQEYDPESSQLFISKLTCSLFGQTMDVFLKAGSQARALYNCDQAEENYYCNFGINPEFRSALDHPQLSISGVDQNNEIRIVELLDHPFFIATLFVPQTRSFAGAPHPLIRGFVKAVCNNDKISA